MRTLKTESPYISLKDIGNHLRGSGEADLVLGKIVKYIWNIWLISGSLTSLSISACLSSSLLHRVPLGLSRIQI